MNIITNDKNILVTEKAGILHLHSYNTHYMMHNIRKGTYTRLSDIYSATSLRHINKAFPQVNMNKKRFLAMELNKEYSLEQIQTL